MIIEAGEKIHVVRRRNFIDDLRRHFVGEITDIHGSLVRVEGYTFVFDQTRGEFMKKNQKRTTLINVGDCGYIVTLIPEEVNIDQLSYQRIESRLVVTDGDTYSLDINEFSSNR